jgi:hypothetical protein
MIHIIAKKDIDEKDEFNLNKNWMKIKNIEQKTTLRNDL